VYNKAHGENLTSSLHLLSSGSIRNNSSFINHNVSGSKGSNATCSTFINRNRLDRDPTTSNIGAISLRCWICGGPAANSNTSINKRFSLVIPGKGF
jgi:hypothetical protein